MQSLAGLNDLHARLVVNTTNRIATVHKGRVAVTFWCGSRLPEVYSEFGVLLLARRTGGFGNGKGVSLPAAILSSSAALLHRAVAVATTGRGLPSETHTLGLERD